jgi:predicted nucleic acid-binding protein
LKVQKPIATTEPIHGLGPGETEAIALAMEIGADLLLIDDRDGVRHARQRGLRVVGTLAVIDEAAARGWLALPDALARLQRTNFRASDALLRSLLEGDAERKARRRE